MVEPTVIAPSLELSVTEPPAPPKPASPEAFNPVVAEMLELTVIFSTALAMKTPPFPPLVGRVPLLNCPASAPLKFTSPIPTSPSKFSVRALIVSRPPEDSPLIPPNWLPLKSMPAGETIESTVKVCCTFAPSPGFSGGSSWFSKLSTKG